MHRQHIFIERIKKLEANSSDNLPVAAADHLSPTYREGSRLELLDSVIQASRVYPFLEDGSLEIERQQFIDQIMFRNGMVPISMLALDDDQKKRASDAAAQLLLRKYNSVEVDALTTGEMTFTSLGSDAEALKLEIGKAVNQSNNSLLLNGVADGK
jgi:hypothetical protein